LPIISQGYSNVLCYWRHHPVAKGAKVTTPHPFAARATGAQAHLRLIETTDLHMHVYPYDYYADRPSDTLGLARAAGLIQTLRAAAPNALLFDCGDFLQGSPLGDFIAQERGLAPGETHPIIGAMNVLGYDAVTVGNHDFNYGVDFLLAALAAARFPCLCANIVGARGAGPLGDTPLLPPAVLLQRDLLCGDGQRRPIRLGVLGLAPPQIADWDRKLVQGRMQTRDMFETACAWVPHLKAQGADLVVVLAHTGIGADEHVPMQENAALPLSRIAGIDALLLGHSHIAYPAPEAGPEGHGGARRGHLNGKPAVMAGFGGSHLGLIDLLVQHRDGRWRVLHSESRSAPVYRRNADQSVTPLAEPLPEVLAAVRGDHEATLRYVRRPVGRTAAPMHSYFALLANDAGSRIVAEAQRWHVAEALAGTEHAALPLLSAAAPFKTGGRAGPDHFTEVPAGDLAMRNIADLYHFPNTIRAVRMSGAELAEWLERSVGVFNQLIPGLQDQALLDPEFPGYNFDVIDGVHFQIDLSRPARYGPRGDLREPAARRIHRLTHLGRPLDPKAAFIVATNNYRAGGGGGFPGTGPDRIVLESPVTNRDILLRFVARQGTLQPPCAAAWSFVPMPGTTALFDSGPNSARYLPDLQGLRIEPLGTTDAGFARYRVSL
jgi:2',3'-cyclic-nucleotide 2'-phosphodiesterase/3'-nucleotidase